jgi:CubicO group peptidase (beta-lactamase class C family)
MTGAVAQPPFFPTLGWRPAPPSLPLAGVLRKRFLSALVAADFPMVTSMLIVKNGYADELCFQGGKTDAPVELFAITQSVVATLFGIALQQGRLQYLDDNLGDLLPGSIGSAAHPYAQQLTLWHLLTMTGGWEWDPRSRWALLSRVGHVEDHLNGPMAHLPGEVFCFDDLNVQLLSHVLSQITGLSASEYAERYLFQPLGIANYTWTQDEWGFTHCWAGLSLSPRDLAKIAYLYLRQGVWEGQQIVPAEFVQAATSAQSAGGYPGNTSYGLLWWVWNERGLSAYYALGYAGRMVFVAPEHDLIVIIVTDDTLDTDHINVTRRLVTDVIVPLVAGL